MWQKGIECFLPLKTVSSRWKDRNKLVELPVFPGYLFVNTEMPERRLDILSAPSTVRVVEFGGKPQPIPGEQIESVRRLIASKLPFDSCPDMAAGERVEVIHGPLAGVQGTFLRSKSAGRLVLSVTLIGQGVACEVHARNVRRVGLN
jgi:transcription antitermination factor NusG